MSHPLLGSLPLTHGGSSRAVDLLTMQDKKMVLLFSSIPQDGKQHPDQESDVVSNFERIAAENSDDDVAFVIVPLNTESFFFLPNVQKVYTVKIWNDDDFEVRKGIISLRDTLFVCNQPQIVAVHRNAYLKVDMNKLKISNTEESLQLLAHKAQLVALYASSGGRSLGIVKIGDEQSYPTGEDEDENVADIIKNDIKAAVYLAGMSLNGGTEEVGGDDFHEVKVQEESIVSEAMPVNDSHDDVDAPLLDDTISEDGHESVAA